MILLFINPLSLIPILSRDFKVIATDSKGDTYAGRYAGYSDTKPDCSSLPLIPLEEEALAAGLESACSH